MTTSWTTKDRLELIEETFSNLGGDDFRREMRELITELHFVYKNESTGTPQAYHLSTVRCGSFENHTMPS